MTEATLTTSQTSSNPKVLAGATPSDDMLIAMRNVWKTYDMGAEKVHALHGVSFDVKRGEYLAITGPSGSG
ncbi:MAG: macrolide ABC transporter ATP-binding protein, partial [Pyrinomonadaceae bacterium]